MEYFDSWKKILKFPVIILQKYSLHGLAFNKCANHVYSVDCASLGIAWDIIMKPFIDRTVRSKLYSQEHFKKL